MENCAQPYEYYLGFWGQINNDDHRWIERDLGIFEKNFWFSTKPERDAFREKLIACAKNHNSCIAFSEKEGFDVRFRTIAQMTLRLSDGRAFPFSYDFGYGYPIDGAHFMFFEGNWSCDCNLSAFLSGAGYDVPEMDCGDSIVIEDFKVERSKTLIKEGFPPQAVRFGGTDKDSQSGNEP